MNLNYSDGQYKITAVRIGCLIEKFMFGDKCKHTKFKVVCCLAVVITTATTFIKISKLKITKNKNRLKPKNPKWHQELPKTF